MKKFSAILLCLLMVITCSLAGCAGFSINKVKYYNEVLATVGNEKITRFDLISAYNSYGESYYVQQMGYDETKALNETLNMLVEREALYQYAKSEGDTYKLKEYQVNSLVKTMFDNLDNTMENYITTACSILDVEVFTPAEKEEKEDEKTYSYDEYLYSPRATVEFDEEANNFVIKYKIEPEDPFTPIIDEQYLKDYTKDGMVDELIAVYFDKLQTELEDKYSGDAKRIYNKVRTLLAEDLISYEKYLRDDNGNKYNKIHEDLFYRYFQRNLDSQIQSAYLTNIRKHYLENESLSMTKLTDKLESMVKIDKVKYGNSLSSYASKMKDIGTDGNSVLYHPTNGEKFGYFLHILISFDENQQAIAKNIDNFKEASSTIMEELNVAGTTVEDRNPSSELGEIKNIGDFAVQYKTLVEDVEDYDTKLQNFIDLMFRVTGDADSTLKAGMPYAIGTESSAMADEFNTEARKLMETENRGETSVMKLNDISSLCITTYGVHVLFYVDQVDAYDVDYNDLISGMYYIADKNDTSDYNLFNKKLNPLTGETYFDMLFDEVYPADGKDVYTSNNGYDEYESDLVNKAKNKFGIEYFRTKIDATKTSL